MTSLKNNTNTSCCHYAVMGHNLRNSAPWDLVGKEEKATNEQNYNADQNQIGIATERRTQCKRGKAWQNVRPSKCICVCACPCGVCVCRSVCACGVCTCGVCAWCVHAEVCVRVCTQKCVCVWCVCIQKCVCV